MLPTRPYETGSEAGFTLVELLVTLAIMALVIAATPVLLRVAIPGVRSDVAARVLASDLRAARAGAIAGGRETWIVFDGGMRGYVSEPWHRARVLAPGINLGLVAAADGTVHRTIVFHADGSSSGGRVLVGAGRWKHSVSADWLTGRVTIDE